MTVKYNFFFVNCEQTSGTSKIDSWWNLIVFKISTFFFRWYDLVHSAYQ